MPQRTLSGGTFSISDRRDLAAIGQILIKRNFISQLPLYKSLHPTGADAAPLVDRPATEMLSVQQGGGIKILETTVGGGGRFVFFERCCLLDLIAHLPGERNLQEGLQRIEEIVVIILKSLVTEEAHLHVRIEIFLQPGISLTDIVDAALYRHVKERIPPTVHRAPQIVIAIKILADTTKRTKHIARVTIGDHNLRFRL